MCGIAGIGNKEDELDVSAAVKDSLECMRHRGPDDKGIEQWSRCCLGMCRLSIVDDVAKLASKEKYMLTYFFTIFYYNDNYLKEYCC